MKNILSFYQKGGFVFGLLCLLLGCNGETAETRVVGTDPETDFDEEQVYISENQFHFSEMELGKLTDHSFTNSIKVNGHIEVPMGGQAMVSSYYGGYVKQN